MMHTQEHESSKTTVLTMLSFAIEKEWGHP